MKRHVAKIECKKLKITLFTAENKFQMMSLDDSISKNRSVING